MAKVILLMTVLTVLIVLPTLHVVFAESGPEEYINRRVVVWNLFFKMMTIAFTVGAVVSGTLIWVIWRFRESHPKAKPTKYEGTEW